MLYNKNNLLKLFEPSNLSLDTSFSSLDIETFLKPLENIFTKEEYTYAYGASKFVIIPNKENYVIKIPFTGSFQHTGSYCENEGSLRVVYHPGHDTYNDFEGAISENCDWDYCAVERERYNKSKIVNLNQCFAEIDLVGYVNEYPIYIQEKATTLENAPIRSYSKEETQKTKKLVSHHLNSIDYDWLTDFRLYHGESKLIKFLTFIHDEEWDDDLRSCNIGYIRKRPILIDYSGFFY